LLDLSKCNVDVREKFRKRIHNLCKSRFYEEVLTNQQVSGGHTVLVHRDGQYVNEIVIANANDMTDAMLVIKGHVNTDNLQRIINDHSSYFNK
jgi:hypothetical protein